MHWLIDGHNLIGQMPNLRLDDPHDEEKLLEYLHRYRAKTGHQVTIVFDAGQSYQAGKTIKRGGITIQFAASGKTADQIIIRRIRKVKNPQTVIVVSSDRAVQQAARQAYVRVVKAQDFAQQLLNTAPGSTQQQDEGNQADVHLSPHEVDEWLKLFNQSNS
jgi:predicted RNA-binding protein with PIN domain